MTILVPHHARPKPMFWLWKKNRAWKKWRRGLRRNPNCNERRRYRDDSDFVVGEHTHVAPLYISGVRFDRVSMPFRPFKINSDQRLSPEDLLYLRINSVPDDQGTSDGTGPQ